MGQSHHALLSNRPGGFAPAEGIHPWAWEEEELGARDHRAHSPPALIGKPFQGWGRTSVNEHRCV